LPQSAVGARRAGGIRPPASRTGQRKRLGELLLEAEVIDEDQLEHALKIHRQTGKQLGRVLVDTNLVEENELIKYLAINLGVDSVDLNDDQLQVPGDAVLMVPERQARRFNLISFSLDEDTETLHVAMANPADVIAVDTIKSITGKNVKVYIASRVAIADAIDKHYAQQYSLDQMGEDLKTVDAELVEAMDDGDMGLDRDAIDAASNAPVVKYVNATLMEAVKQRASDIHFEPFEREVAVRFRIDGALREVTAPPKRLFQSVVARIAIEHFAHLPKTSFAFEMCGKARPQGFELDGDLRVPPHQTHRVRIEPEQKRPNAPLMKSLFASAGVARVFGAVIRREARQTAQAQGRE
jgi:hypothetical protein